MYFGIFLEYVIMEKRGRSEKYFISCAFAGVLDILSSQKSAL